MAQPGRDFPGVGVGLVVTRQGRILLYRRVNAPEAGFWNIVGGKVDAMEPAANAARREAEEETGLKIGRIDFLCVTEQIIEADAQHWVSLIYRCEDFTGEATLTEPDKLSEMGWFALDALPHPLSAFTKAALHYLVP